MANVSSVQFCKNIVLAGVGSLTLNDDRPVTDELLSANFLIPPDESLYSGKSLAELCCDSLKEFNPMVRVSVQKGPFLLFFILDLSYLTLLAAKTNYPLDIVLFFEKICEDQIFLCSYRGFVKLWYRLL